MNDSESNNTKLPTIQGLWYGSVTIGQMESLSIASFMRHGHEYHLYSYEEIENLPKGAVNKDARQIYPTFEQIKNKDGKILGAAFSDLFRYKLLLEKGNYWADLDVVCVKAFDFKEERVLAAERHRPNARPTYRINGVGNTGINCNVMKFPAGSEEMSYCFEKALNFDRTKLVFAEIGPELITRCAIEYDLDCFIKPPDTFNPINYFDFRVLVNPHRKPLISSDTYGIHLWSGAWGNRSWKQRLLNILERTPAQIKNNMFPQSTLYGELIEKYLGAR